MAHILLATGDLAMDRADYDESFVATREVLRAADLTFGQLETSFANGGTRLPQARHAVRAGPEGAAALGRAGFDVISMAGNHCMDWGSEAFFETRANLLAAGIQVVGAGADIAAARQPARFTLGDGTRLAVLAYSSILPHSYWADERRPSSRRLSVASTLMTRAPRSASSEAAYGPAWTVARSRTVTPDKG